MRKFRSFCLHFYLLSLFWKSHFYSSPPPPPPSSFTWSVYSPCIESTIHLCPQRSLSHLASYTTSLSTCHSLKWSIEWGSHPSPSRCRTGRRVKDVVWGVGLALGTLSLALLLTLTHGVCGPSMVHWRTLAHIVCMTCTAIYWHTDLIF